MSDDTQSLADIMATLSQQLHQHHDMSGVLDDLVHVARDNIPGVEYAGVSLTHTNGPIETVAATDHLVNRIDDLQYTLREGPCIDAITTRQQTWTNHLASDERWPRFGPAAHQLGIESQMGVALFDEPELFGGLNLYATYPDAFTDDSTHVASLFATHAAHALGRTIQQTQLTEALTTRRTIGIAMGLVMERYVMDEHRAFQFLVRTSQTGNIKLRDVANGIVQQANQRHP